MYDKINPLRSEPVRDTGPSAPAPPKGLTTMTPVQDLAQRIDTLPAGGDREVDWLLAERFLGMTRENQEPYLVDVHEEDVIHVYRLAGENGEVTEGSRPEMVPLFTSRVDHAIDLIQRVFPDTPWHVRAEPSENGYYANVGGPHVKFLAARGTREWLGRTPALALMVAMLCEVMNGEAAKESA